MRAPLARTGKGTDPIYCDHKPSHKLKLKLNDNKLVPTMEKNGTRGVTKTGMRHGLMA
jgi:hypothetical protein